MEKFDPDKRVSLSRAEDIVKRTIQNLEKSGSPQANAMSQLSLVLLSLVQSQARTEDILDQLTKRIGVLLNEAGVDARNWKNPTPS